MTISVDAETIFDKIQHAFNIKTLKASTGRKLIQPNKGLLWRSL